MKRLSFFFVLFLLFAISSTQAQDNSVLTITRVEDNGGVLKIDYRVADPKGDSFVTAGWQFSTDNGKTWTSIPASAIGDNAFKPPGESFITWDIAKTEAFKAVSHPRVLFRMYVWNPNDKGSWRAVRPMPTERLALSAVALNGKIYAIGGFNGNFLNTVEEYTPNDDKGSWRVVAPITSPRWGIAAATLNGRLYATGGGDTDEYTPETNNWRIVAPITPLRWGIAAATLNGRLYAMGGWDGAGGKSNNIVEEYTLPRAS